MKTHFLPFLKSFFAELLFLSPEKKKTLATPAYTYAGDKILLKILEKNTTLEHINSSIYALFQYQDADIKRSIWALKYNKDSQAIRFFATILMDELISCASDRLSSSTFNMPSFLLAIPSSSYANGLRTFDQMKEVIDYMLSFPEMSSFFLYLPDFFSQPQDAKVQSKLKNRHARVEYASKRLHISDTYINLATNPAATQYSLQYTLDKKPNVYIIDDIVTTGSTCTHAIHLCNEIGLYHIKCIALCH